MEDAGTWSAPELPEVADHFDRLPDPVVLLIFNRIGDVKALGRCRAVSRRFHAFVSSVDSVVVRVDCVLSDDPASPSAGEPRGVLSHLAHVILSGIVKPLHAIMAPPSPRRESSHHSPVEVLRGFKEIRRLRIELPAAELGVADGVLLKWKAAFGSTLDTCVILGADNDPGPVSSSDDSGSIPEWFYTNGSLKLRVVWTISSLIAASARHYLLQRIVSDHEKLESLDLTDADGQGTLTMDRAQLQELRVRPVSASGSSQRTLVPALDMRLWYAPFLDLPGGVVLKGATLVAIRPSSGEQQQQQQTREVGGGSDAFAWVANAFEEPYRSAARLLVKRRIYCLEMNSF